MLLRAVNVKGPLGRWPSLIVTLINFAVGHQLVEESNGERRAGM
jgi:hypothetical protein